MKVKLLSTVFVIGALCCTANAATVTISSGFGGITVTDDSLNDVAYIQQIGIWEGAVFTQFGTAQVDAIAGQKIGGAFAGSGPASVNSKPVAIRIEAGGNWTILQSATPFPDDVSQVLATQTVGAGSAGVLPIVASSVPGGASYDGNQLSITPVPEPGIAALGLIGFLGLLRRRR